MKNFDVNSFLIENGLDFEIIKSQLHANVPTQVVGENGNLETTNQVVPTPYFGLINSNSGNCINTVKEGYEPTQNVDVVNAVVKGLNGFDNVSIQRANSINDGRKIAIQLAINDYVDVNGDEIKKYVTILDSNDGSSGLSVGIGNLTMSCQNQFFKFYKASQFKARHTKSIVESIKELPNLIRFNLEQSNRVVELFNRFESTKVSRVLAHTFVNKLIGIDKRMTENEIRELGKDGRSINRMESIYNNIDIEMNSKGNNVWGLFSGITRYTTHEASAPKRENGRTESLIVGSNYKFNQDAFKVATELHELYA